MPGDETDDAGDNEPMTNGNGGGTVQQSAPTYTYRPTKETPPEVFQYIVTRVKKNKKDTSGILFREFVDGLVAFRLSHDDDGAALPGAVTVKAGLTDGSGISAKDKQEIVDAICKRVQSTSDSVKSYVKTSLDESMGSVQAGDGTIPSGHVTATISPEELRQIQDGVNQRLDALASTIGKALDSTKGDIRGEVKSAIGTTRGDIVKAIQEGNSELSEKLATMASKPATTGGQPASSPQGIPVTLPDDLKRQLLGIAKDIADLREGYSRILDDKASQPLASSPHGKGAAPAFPSARISREDGISEHVTVTRPKDGDAASVGGADASQQPAASVLEEGHGTPDGPGYGPDDGGMQATATSDGSLAGAFDGAVQQGTQMKGSMTIDDILASLDDATDDIQSVLGDAGGNYAVDAADAKAFAQRIMGDDAPDAGNSQSEETEVPTSPYDGREGAASMGDMRDTTGEPAAGYGPVAPTAAPQADDGSTDMNGIVGNILDDDWGDMLDDIGNEDADAMPAASNPNGTGGHAPDGNEMPNMSVADLDAIDFGDVEETGKGAHGMTQVPEAPAPTATDGDGRRRLVLPDRIRRKEKGSSRYHIDMTADPQVQQPQSPAEEDDDFDL